MLLKQYLREEHREEMYENFKASQNEELQGKLKFSASIYTLKQLIDNKAVFVDIGNHDEVY
jgi:hypothetical protein